MTMIVDAQKSTITIVVPIEIRRRNGRPKIVLPNGGSHTVDAVGDRPSGAVVRAIARAWDWRRRLDAGEVSTLQDIADAEKVTLPFVSQSIRLACLSPEVLHGIVSGRAAVAASLVQLCSAANQPWTIQAKQVNG